MSSESIPVEFYSSYSYLASCAEGLEDIVAYELKLFGIGQLSISTSGVYFNADVGRLKELQTRMRTVDFIYKVQRGSALDSEQEKRNRWPRMNFTLTKLTKPLYLRDYRVYNHPSSLKPSVAASLLLTTDMSRDLLDPFVGGGTIVVEDALMTRLSGRKSLPYQIKPHRILGIDINPKHLSGARKNAREAGVSDIIHFMLGDSTKVSLEARYSRMVTNPPFGVRGGKKERIKKMYERFVSNIDRLLLPRSEGIVITSDWKILEELMRERGILVRRIRRIRHKKLWTGAIYFNL
ncbi:MAG: THUMP domain-containing class I SAM-dependent methyltransferase [Conexivisphaerales archaeon]